MADINTDLPIIITQLPQLQKVAHAEAPLPEVQQAHAALLAQQQLQQDRKQVQKVASQEGMATVQGDGGRQKDPDRQPGNRHQAPSHGEEDATSSNASPWTGNIIDVKI